MNTVIYADILVAVNFIVNYLLLRAVSAFFSVKHSTARFLISSLSGGLFSMVIFIENIPMILNLLFKLVFLSLMVFVAFNTRKLKDFIRYSAAFFICNFSFAGIMLAFKLLFSSENILIKNGVIYFDLNFITLVISAVICYIIISLISRLVSNRAVNKLIYEVELFYENKSVNAKALLDTGNTLRELFSGKPVIVAEKNTAAKIFPDKCDISELKNFRLIPFSTISSSGALPAFLLEKVIVISCGKTVEINDVYLAVSDKKIVSSDYSVLLGTAFLNELST